MTTKDEVEARVRFDLRRAMETGVSFNSQVRQATAEYFADLFVRVETLEEKVLELEQALKELPK